MDPGPLRSFLRPIVVCAFVGLFAVYGLNIASKMHRGEVSTFPDPNLDQSAATDSKGLFMALVDTDIPSTCLANPQLDDCPAAISEVKDGHNGVLKCGYFDANTGKTKFYFFWYKSAPAELVRAAKTDPKSSLRPLGGTAVQDCPAFRAEADALFTENNH